MSAFGNGSNSNGQFWYGSQTNFPGFLYKKNLGVGGRRSTKFSPGGNTTCNTYQYLYNKYKPGQGGVGASSTSNRRAKNRAASICNGPNQQCGAFYTYLGRYNNYTENPNGFFNYPLYPLSQITKSPTISGSYSNGKINLVWSFDNSYIVSSWNLYQNGVMINISNNPTYSYSFTVSAGSTYNYYIVAVDTFGRLSPVSNTVSIYVPIINEFTGTYVTSTVIYLSKTYYVVSFKGAGTAELNFQVYYIVVGGAGGGGGGSTGFGGGGGGGGGGGVVEGSFYGNSTYTITVGAGGSGGTGEGETSSTNGYTGISSQISGIITVAGGGGGTRSSFGSNGGAGGVSGNGGAGGLTASSGTNGGGGGGGNYGLNNNNGNGATSTTSVSLNNGTNFGAGGGGGGGDSEAGAGGNSYAGNGGGYSGIANYGGGGGGGAGGNGSGGGAGGAGGAGIVILYWQV